MISSMTILRVAAVVSAVIAGHALDGAARAQDVVAMVPVAALHGLVTPKAEPLAARPDDEASQRPSMEVQLATGDGQQGDIAQAETVVASRLSQTR